MKHIEIHINSSEAFRDLIGDSTELKMLLRDRALKMLARQEVSELIDITVRNKVKELLSYDQYAGRFKDERINSAAVDEVRKALNANATKIASDANEVLNAKASELMDKYMSEKNFEAHVAAEADRRFKAKMKAIAEM